jgi:hypothetical protein
MKDYPKPNPGAVGKNGYAAFSLSLSLSLSLAQVSAIALQQ